MGDTGVSDGREPTGYGPAGSPMKRLLREGRHAVPGTPGSPLRFS